MKVESPIRYWPACAWALAILATLVTFADSPSQELHGIAAFYAALTREMLDTGDLLAPFKGPDAYLLKPPLALWFSALSAAVFGINDFAMTLPSRLGGLGCVALTFLLGRRLYGTAGGWFAALIFVTNGIYIQFTTTFRLDSLMTFGALLALWGYLNLQHARGACCLFGGFTIATLIKGPMILVMAALFVPHAAVLGHWRRYARTTRYWALLLVLPLIWYGYLWLLHGPALGEQLNYDFWRGDTTVGLTAVDSALLDYVAKPVRRLWPWLPFMLVAVGFGLRDVFSVRKPRTVRADIALILSLFALNYVVAALKPDPDVRYLYPSLSLLAVMTGGLFSRMTSGQLPRWIFPTMTGLCVLVIVYAGFYAYRGAEDQSGLRTMQSLAAQHELTSANTAAIAHVLARAGAPRRTDLLHDSAYYYFGFAPTGITWPAGATDLPPQYRYFIARRKRVHEQWLRELGLHPVARSRKLLLFERRGQSGGTGS